MLIKKSYTESPRLFNIVEELKDGFCTIDQAGDFIYTNLAAKEMMGININKGQVNFFRNIVKNEKSINYIKDFLNENDYLKDFDIDLFTTSNCIFPALLTINLIKNPNKKVIGMSILIKDMTYIKKVQQQLLQAQKMESIGMLASGVAHEFNNILTGIIPNAELIKLTTSAEDANHTRAESIQKSANRAADIVKKLLNFARSDKTDKSKITDFVKSARETIDILRKLFDRNIKLESDFCDDLCFAKMDETSLQQIIMNLAINAKDAISGHGTIKFQAENYFVNKNIKSRHNNLGDGKYIRFQIKDNGHGIEKEKLKYIFDPFYTTKKPGKGTGLGLSMVYGLVNSVNGEIEVRSIPNVETTFTVYLPATEPIIENKSEEFKNRSIGKGFTVLVIDDEPMILDMAKDMLESLNFKVLSAINGVKGLEIYKDKKDEIDVILLDLLMPEMSGKTCFEHMRKIDPLIKIIITSGIGELEKKKELEKMGATAYLEKPYSMEDITNKLSDVLKK